MVDEYINPIGVKTPQDTAQEERQVAAQAAANPDDGQFWSTVFRAGTMVDEVGEFLDIQRQKKYDPAFEFTQPMTDSILQNYNTNEADYLTKATSQDEFKLRQHNVELDRQEQQRLQNYGATGAAATMAVSLIDPVGLAIGAATGGLGKAIQVGRVGRIAAGAAIAGAEGLGTSVFEKQFNTSMTDTDVVMQTVFSAGLGTAGSVFASKGDTVAANLAKEVENKAYEASYNMGNRHLSAAGVEGRNTQMIELGDAEQDIVDKFQQVDLDSDINTVKAFGGDNMVSDMMGSVYTAMTSSKSSTIRGWAHSVFENPQGATREGTIAKSNAAMDLATIGRRMRTVGGGAFTRNEAFAKELAQQETVGMMGKTKAMFSFKARADFDKKVFHALQNKDLYARSSDNVKAAVDSVQAQFSDSLDQLKAAGVKGFEDVKFNKHYVPKVLKVENVLAATRRFGADNVKRVISKAYQEGGLKLKPKAADMLAERRLDQTLRGHTAVDRPELATTAEDMDYLRSELESAGVDSETIDSIIDAKVEDIDMELISDRAKKSLQPSIEANHGGLSYYDLMNNDLEHVMEQYIREQAANVAFKRNIGEGSYRAVKRQLDTIARGALNEGVDPSRLKRETDIMSQMVDVMYGKSINRGDDRLIKGAQRLRSFTAIIRLQAMGITNLGELPRVIANQGMDAILRSNPLMSRERIRELNRTDLMEADELLSFNGEDWAFEPTSMDLDAIDDLKGVNDGRYAQGMKTLDKMLAAGQRASGVANLFRVTQGMGEKMSVRAVTHKLKHNKINEQHARDAGWVQPKYDDVPVQVTREKLDYTKINPKTGEYGLPTGEQVTETVMQRQKVGETNRLDDLKKWMDTYGYTKDGYKHFDLEKMQQLDPDLFLDLQRGVMRLSSRDMQRMHHGEVPLFFNNWLGQTFMQFKTFSYASLSKQLVHDIRGDRSIAATTFGLGLGMAYLINGVKTGLTAAGDPSKSWEDEWKENMEGRALGYTLLNTMGQPAALSLGLDALATLGVTPDEWNAQESNNWKGGQTLMPAAAGTIKDAQGLVQSVYDGDWEQAAKNAHNITPLAKTIGISQGIQQLYK